VQGQANEAKATFAKLKAKTAAQRGKRKKASQNINVKYAWDAEQVAWGQGEGGAKPDWLLGFPGRDRQLIMEPQRRKDGKPSMRGIGGQRVQGAHFLGVRSKEPILEALGPRIFFDEQLRHISPHPSSKPHDSNEPKISAVPRAAEHVDKLQPCRLRIPDPCYPPERKGGRKDSSGQERSRC
jgi:hypothetical protein